MINNKKPKAALDNDEEVEMMAQMMAMFPNIEGAEILRVYRSCRGNASECVDILFKKSLQHERKQAKAKKQTQKMLERELRKAMAQEIVESFPPLPAKDEPKPEVENQEKEEVQRVQKSMEALNLRECPDESIASVVNDLKAKVKSEIFSASLASVGPNMDLAQRTRDIKRNLALSLLEDDSDASPSQCIPPKSSSSAPIPVAHPRPEFFPPHPWMSHPMPMPHQMPIVYPESFYPYPPYNMYPHAFPPSPWMSHPMPQPGPFFGNPPQHPLPYPILDQGFPMGENRNVIPNSHSIPPFYPPYPYMPY